MDIQRVITAIAPLRTWGEVTDIDIACLLTDSRQLLVDDASHTLFFAIRTAHRDGAQFVPELVAQGVPAVVVQTGVDEALMARIVASGALVLEVEDTVLALQRLAAYKRSLFSGEVIGITGSNGKTVVKEWLYQLLKDDYHVIRSPKSYNSQIGVPLSVWQLPSNAEGTKREAPNNLKRAIAHQTTSNATPIALFEAGISQPGEMARLEAVICPTIGVVTYIGPEHGENFASLEEKRSEKMRLFTHSRVVVEDDLHQNVRTCAGVLRVLGYDEDEIQRRILRQTHETVLEVNLSALVDNVRYFRSHLKPETKLTCMVKAFAYGAGSVEVSRALQESGLVDYLAVAVADEGVELRRAGITLPIIIMSPEVAALDLILENNLQPNIYSFQALDNIIAAASAKGIEHYPVHIKIDSGMHRLGFYREEMDTLVARLRDQQAVRVQSVFSHLAGSDEAQFDAFTLDQIHYFSACADQLINGVAIKPLQTTSNAAGTKPLKHICNTAGIERFSDYQFDMCRLGIGLYGQSFVGAKLRTVCTLRTTLLSVKTVPAGDTIGYGRHTHLDEPRRIGVIPIGYADGFDRRFSNYGGEVIVRGKRCPIVGNVCMDQAMVDITDTDAQVGDSVEIFGERLPLSELSDKLGTITYEVLTSVSRRVQRVYTY